MKKVTIYECQACRKTIKVEARTRVQYCTYCYSKNVKKICTRPILTFDTKKITTEAINNNGATVSITSDTIPQKGYMVSLQGTEKTVSANATEIQNALREYISKNATSLSNPNHYLGLWINNNICYIDISVNVTNKKTAIKMAKTNNQLAIFDIKNKTSIYTR